MADLSPNEIARRLATNDGVIGPKFTITLEPRQFEDNPKFVDRIMSDTKLIASMLEMYFSIMGLTKVTLVWENLNMVRAKAPE
jgi:hypothetical protein